MPEKKYPKVNYIGNKEKIADWICQQIPADADTVLDAFSGGCSFAYEAKKRGYRVLTNDILNINQQLATALIENDEEILLPDDVELIFSGQPFSGFMTHNYANVHFFPDECQQLDLYRKNIEKLKNPFKKAMAFSLLRRAMIRKMPYSRFTINWEKVKQLRDEEYSYAKYGRKRAYHNESFRTHFEKNLPSYNHAVFSNGWKHHAYNLDIFNLLEKVEADIVYLDPPYTGTMNNYFGFYGMMDGYLTSRIPQQFSNHFMDKKTAVILFTKLFEKLKAFKYWMLSYNNASHPNKDELLTLLDKDGRTIKVLETPHVYKVTGREKKQENKELLFLIENKRG
ncbi:DNA adenine methylase [Neisseria perflava]|uniref:DNA adenine methylase n=1 Tax=Neisseria perflava TaxID=33053 RepID=UPI00209CDCF7|nr:DNA adenine methylase [Neisseria perflava]MCP1661150.1 adenine-specific DNA-methyltransferase [Neisseria perflava]